MNSPVEMEKKFQVHGEGLKHFLKSKNFVSSKVIVDEYLDTPDGLFYQDGIFIRVRNGKSLDFKFNPNHLGAKGVNEHIVCHEYNVALPFDVSSCHVFETLQKMIQIKCPNPYTYDEFLKVNNLQTLLILNKNRTTYGDDIFIISVDEFADFGVFLELEVKNNNMSQETFLQKVEEATKDLTVKAFNSGYIELRLRQINEPLYLKGKYLIDLDMAV